jgi:ADP-ribose pyrophosphatase YjhB (NUDIX family)
MLIPKELYDKIIASIPIVGVEGMIVNNNALLLMKRNSSPAKGEWWFPGGRLRKGESFEPALCREVKEEIGVDPKIKKFIGIYNRPFPERHDVTLTYLCEITNNYLSLNEEHSTYHFFQKQPSNLHPFIIRVIDDSGWHFVLD